MSVSGYLLPFPDPGAADLMSDHLEQEVHAAGPGKIRLRVSLPGTRFDEAGSPAHTGTRFARKKLEGFCRKVRFLGQNPKIGYQEFNELQTPQRKDSGTPSCPSEKMGLSKKS